MTDNNWKSRTELLLESSGVKKLEKAHVLLVGLGGVGGYAAEQLARAGIGKLTLVDHDTVHISNINRQIIAFRSTIDKSKADLIENRLLDINPDLQIQVLKTFVEKKNLQDILDENYDYAIDAIDTLTPKVEFIKAIVERKIALVSSMGSGGKSDPQQVQIADVSKSHHCKFAYKVRKCLHKYGIRKGFQVVFSPEQVPQHAILETGGEGNKRSVVGTISYMPAIFGCFCASVAIKGILDSTS